MLQIRDALTSIISNCAISLKTSVRKIGLHIITFVLTAELYLLFYETFKNSRIELVHSGTKYLMTTFAFERYNDGDSSKF